MKKPNKNDYTIESQNGIWINQNGSTYLDDLETYVEYLKSQACILPSDEEIASQIEKEYAGSCKSHGDLREETGFLFGCEWLRSQVKAIPTELSVQELREKILPDDDNYTQKYRMCLKMDWYKIIQYYKNKHNEENNY